MLHLKLRPDLHNILKSNIEVRSSEIKEEKMVQMFDVIIIGAGPNGLATGAYLSKAGQKVLLVEKRLEEGGGLMTEQVTVPEFYHNTHAKPVASWKFCRYRSDTGTKWR